MTRFRVVVSATASTHMRAVQRWSMANDRGAIDVLRDEVEAAIDRLAGVPCSGAPYDLAPVPGVRRLLLRRSGYHLYYTIDAEAAEVTVRAIWYAGRGSPPGLG